MRKFLVLAFIAIAVPIQAPAQSINPPTEQEYCPDSDITFSVVLPGVGYTNLSIFGIGGAFVSRQPFDIASINGATTFKFVGDFWDVLVAQSFRVSYTLAGQNKTQDFTFKKIKSFFHSGPASIVQPFPSQITAQRCQSQSFSIAFNQVRFENPWESPRIIYGLSSTYEYALPTGWGLNGGAPSTGSNDWKVGTNNATVTADLTHGAGGSILVRAINSCGANLAKGPITPIPISRPAPTLTIVGGLDVVCSGTSTYTVNGVPPGAAVTWSTSDPNVASILAPGTGASVTVAKTGIGSVTLSATVTDCAQSYVTEKPVTMGVQPIDRFLLSGERFDYGATGPGSSFSVCPNENIQARPNIVGINYNTMLEHQWEYVSGNYQYLSEGNIFSASARTSPGIRENLSLRYRYRNTCGWSDWDYVSFGTMNCDIGEEPY